MAGKAPRVSHSALGALATLTHEAGEELDV
jgi:hypothetical protein